ncbi:uncharacterized protein CDV56_108282 [Aspergillus thermomutatus]|uniref:Uncharacterized protein n=1 Tax=Aspergillus thermomutatus TaxID=41047 RepID=A0A397H6N2_ASPTH|nr:uncharacterized protein CDV56_108282 [Aspergillus thermomutatus]RHZ57316.1 hypothetical protein CDV56_108282 [Aspergillus thermomutatus]
MPKKGGKGKKGKGKAGGGTAKKAPAVHEPVTPGHQVEDIFKGEGEGETTESLAPGTATNVPSAAPPQVAASTGADGTPTTETTESGDLSNEEVEEPLSPGTAKRFSLTKPSDDAGGPGLRMPTSLPDTREAAEFEANEHTLQGAVGKTQASKAGLVGSLDAGDSEGQAILPDTVAKESKLTAPTTAPDTTVPEATATEAAAPVPVITDANAPVSEVGGAGDNATGLAEKEAAVERAEVSGAAETALPERLKEKETAAAEPTATSPSDGHAKRPYESSLFHKDEDHKPPKMAKVEEDLDTVPATQPVSTETQAANLQTVQPLVVPGLGAESTDKPPSDAEIAGLAPSGQKAEPATTEPSVLAPVTEPTATAPSTTESQTAEAVPPTAAPSAAQAAAATTSPVVPAAVSAAAAGGEADTEARQKQEVRDSIQAFTGERQIPTAKGLQQEHEEKAKEKALETAPLKTTQETPTKAQPSVAAAAAAAAMRGKSAASPEKATPTATPTTEAAAKPEAEPKGAQGPTEATQDQIPTETQRGEEAGAEETQQPETAGAKKSHEEAQTAVDQAQEAAKAEAAKAEKRKSGFWSWVKRKVKGT